MHPGRIAELLEPYMGPANDQRLTTDNLRDISTFIDILMRWNSRINLTAIRNQEEIVTRHFGESFFAARHLFPIRSHVAADAFVRPAEKNALANQPPTSNPRVADLGSGAGFPGIPLKLWAPNIALTLIESNHKRAVFLREVIRVLTLTHVDIQNVRGETLVPSAFDVVTIRAIDCLAEILPVAASLLAPSGCLALLVSSSQVDAIYTSVPYLYWHPPVSVPQSHSRVLLSASFKAHFN